MNNRLTGGMDTEGTTRTDTGSARVDAGLRPGRKRPARTAGAVILPGHGCVGRATRTRIEVRRHFGGDGWVDSWTFASLTSGRASRSSVSLNRPRSPASAGGRRPSARSRRVSPRGRSGRGRDGANPPRWGGPGWRRLEGGRGPPTPVDPGVEARYVIQWEVSSIHKLLV